MWPLGRKAEESLQALERGLEEMTSSFLSSSELWHSVTDGVVFPLFYFGEKMDLLTFS